MKPDELKSIADAISAQDQDAMYVYLLVTLIAIVAVYFFSRLSKSAELREINNNFATVLEQQRKITEETGKIKQALDKDSISYQVRLNSYNEKSISAITEVYISLIGLREKARHLSLDRSENVRRDLIDCVNSFRSTFDVQKIWLPRDLSTRIEAVAIDIENRCHRFIRASTVIDNTQAFSAERLEAAITEQEQFYDFIAQEISALFDDVVHQISGVVQPGAG